MKIGLALGGGDGLTVAELVARIVSAERDGFATAWLAQIFSLDALTVLALAGQQTSRIELGTAVIPTYPRHPHSLAQQAQTVNVATGGRLALGIGRSHQVVIESMFGLAYDKPVAHVREYVEILRALTTTGSCSIEGKAYRVKASLNVKEARPLPILIGALRPKMLEICGRLCDGTLTWMSGPRHIERTIVPALAKASAEAGRPRPRVVCSLPVCVTDDRDKAREHAARLFAIYGQLPVYRACIEDEGAGGPADLALIGNEEAVRSGLARVRDAGATDFYAAVFPDGRDGGSSDRSYAFLKSLKGSM
jgi:F420-dependent oxidoreductase-like protein